MGRVWARGLLKSTGAPYILPSEACVSNRVCPTGAAKLLEYRGVDDDGYQAKRVAAPTVGSVEYFTGTVRIEPLFQAPNPARVVGARVTFEPGARTAWHTHPLGQTLIVSAGCGWAQRDGGPVEEIRPGDVVWFAPGEKHWHGATATTGMTHFAIQEALDGKAVEWLEKVSDEHYRR